MNILINGLPLLGQKTGIGHYTHQLARYFTENQHHVSVFLGSQWLPFSAADESLRSPALPEATSPTRIESRWHKLFSLAAWQRLLRHLLVHAKRHLGRHVPQARAMACRLMQSRFNSGPAGHVVFEPNFISMHSSLPTVVTVHDLSWLHYPETHPADRVAFMQANFARSVEEAAHIITVSAFIQTELEQLYPATRGKVTTVHNGVDHDAYFPRSAEVVAATLQSMQLSYAQYFLVLGTVEPRKNIQAAVAAHDTLSEADQKRYPLVIVGASGWRTSAIEEALQSGVDKGSIRVLGYVSDADCRALVAAACALVYPSRYEGFGLPPLEAMASAVPVIASNRSAMPEVIADAGLLCDADNSDEFAAAMQLFIDAPEQRQQWGQRGYARAQQFSWAQCARETEALLAAVALSATKRPAP